MSNGFYAAPKPVNEPVLSYRKGSQERKEVLNTYKELYNKTVVVPLYIGA